MSARLGNVLYWFCCLIAVGGVIFVYCAGQPKNTADYQTVAIAAGAVAIPAFLIGRALRYVLAGR